MRGAVSAEARDQQIAFASEMHDCHIHSFVSGACIVNVGRLLVTIVVMFVAVFVTDFLIHSVWLGSTYAETKELWRTEAEMSAKFPFMLLGQLLIAAAFSTIFALAIAEKRDLQVSLIYALAVGVIAAGGQIIMYAVQPYPGTLIVKWCAAYVVQMLVLGGLVHVVYRPRA